MALIRISRNRGAIIASVAVVLAFTLAGCGTSKSSSTSSAQQAGPAIAPDNEKAGAGAAPTGQPIDPAALQRSIIYRGAISVRVDDVNAAAAVVSSVVTGAGGYVGGDNRVVDSIRSSATLVLRVPAGKFGATVDAVSHLGKEINRQVSTEDVTAQVIDVDSRVKTQQASVDRIRTLLAQARSISDIVSLEGELTHREADLESLQAQQRSLSDLTALSTITATLLGPEAATVKKEPKQTGFVGGIKAGWHTFLASLRVLLTIIGALLPFLIAIGVPVLIVTWLVRRSSRKTRQSIAASMAAAAPSAADSSSTAPPNP